MFILSPPRPPVPSIRGHFRVAVSLNQKSQCNTAFSFGVSCLSRWRVDTALPLCILEGELALGLPLTCLHLCS